MLLRAKVQRFLITSLLGKLATLPTYLGAYDFTLPTYLGAHDVTLPTYLGAYYFTLPIYLWCHITYLGAYNFTLPMYLWCHITYLPSCQWCHIALETWLKAYLSCVPIYQPMADICNREIEVLANSLTVTLEKHVFYTIANHNGPAKTKLYLSH